MYQSGRLHRLATSVTASLGPKMEAVDVIVQIDHSRLGSGNWSSIATFRRSNTHK